MARKRTYYTLLALDSTPGATWAIEFGDYDRETVESEMGRKGNKFIGAMGVADKLFDRDDWRWNIAVSASYRLISGWQIITDADGILVEEVA